MKNKLTNNLLLKILSLFFAFVLWLIVVNINDPDITTTISGIEITVMNEDAVTRQGTGQVYTVDSPASMKATGKFTGPRSLIDNLSKEDIKAVVDFSTLSSVGAVTINYVLPEGITKVSATETMKISVEPLLSEKFQIEFTANGTPAAGYTLGYTQISPNVVNIKAPQSVMEQIKEVRVEVDVDGMSTDISDGQAEIVLIDGNGKEISYKENKNITMSTSTLLVDVTMLKTQEVALQLYATGTEGEGYRYTGLLLSASTITLKGLKNDMAGVTSLEIPTSEGLLDITGLTENTEVTVDLLPYLPNGASLLYENERYVTVTLLIEPLQTKRYMIPTDMIAVKNAPDGMDFSYLITDSIEVELEGLQSELDAITLQQLTPEIDLNGLRAGTHSCNISLALPERVRAVAAVRVTVVLAEREPETTTGSSEEETTTERETTRSDSSNNQTADVPVIIRPTTTTPVQTTGRETTTVHEPSTGETQQTETESTSRATESTPEITSTHQTTSPVQE